MRIGDDLRSLSKTNHGSVLFGERHCQMPLISCTTYSLSAHSLVGYLSVWTGPQALTWADRVRCRTKSKPERHNFLNVSNFVHSFDLDLPKNCDDEYWENVDNPERNFEQPPERPAATGFFIHLVKLNKIIALALDTIVSLILYDALLATLAPNPRSMQSTSRRFHAFIRKDGNRQSWQSLTPQ